MFYQRNCDRTSLRLSRLKAHTRPSADDEYMTASDESFTIANITHQPHLTYMWVNRAGLTIRGTHTNVRRGPFSHTRTQDFLSRDALFFSQKVDDLFLSRQQRQHSVVKNWQLIGGTLAAGAPPMVQSAQWIIRPCGWWMRQKNCKHWFVPFRMFSWCRVSSRAGKPRF